jgi:hypothetical protein
MDAAKDIIFWRRLVLARRNRCHETLTLPLDTGSSQAIPSNDEGRLDGKLTFLRSTRRPTDADFVVADLMAMLHQSRAVMVAECRW